MDVPICARFSDSVVKDIDKLIEAGVYMNRSDAVRDLTRRGVREEFSKLDAEVKA